MKDLKKIELKTPAIVRDLYQDLRDRRLLPLVALLLVAIVAAPLLLSDSGSSAKDEAAVPAPPIAQADSTPAVAVVRATPGLRKPERLDHRRPHDPFKQKYVSPPLSDQPVTIEGSPSGPEEDVGGGEAPVGGTEVRSEVVFYATATTLKITRSETTPAGEAVHEEPVIRERVLPSTTLIGPKAQVVTYMGASPKTRNPTFLISDQVTAVFGEGNCLAGTDRCQLIELKEDEPEVFVYGANDVRYRVTVLGTEIVETGRADPP